MPSSRIPRRESPSRQHERVVIWNREYPVGTPVTLETPEGQIIKSRIVGEAWMLEGHTAYVSTANGPVPLALVKPIPPEAR